MRRVLPLVAACLALVCGYEAASAAPAAPGPGRRLVAALLAAARRHDAKTVWPLLSRPSQRRLGRAGVVRLERELGPFEPRSATVFLDRILTDRFGVVALRNGRRALAFPLRREGTAWKLETPGPLRLRVLGPAPGSRGRVAQVAFEAVGPGPADDAVVFVDGRLYPPYLVPSGRTATVYVTLRRALKRGVHVAVGYAEQGANVSALAWSFSASG